MEPTEPVRTRGQRATGTTLIVLTAFALATSSIAKLAGIRDIVRELNAHGLYSGAILLVASLEILSATTFIIPATRAVGLLLISAFLGGAMATHLEHGESMAPPAILLALAWTGVWLRNPVAFWSRAFARRGRSA